MRDSAEVHICGSDAEIIQIRHTGKGYLYYIVDSEGESAVIDALLDSAVYLSLAQQSNTQLYLPTTSDVNLKTEIASVMLFYSW